MLLGLLVGILIQNLNKKKMHKIPEEHLQFTYEAKSYFKEWFDSNVSPYSFISEYFYGDCQVDDEKMREDLMYQWVQTAFLIGYNYGQANKNTN